MGERRIGSGTGREARGDEGVKTGLSAVININIMVCSKTDDPILSGYCPTFLFSTYLSFVRCEKFLFSNIRFCTCVISNLFLPFLPLVPSCVLSQYSDPLCLLYTFHDLRLSLDLCLVTAQFFTLKHDSFLLRGLLFIFILTVYVGYNFVLIFEFVGYVLCLSYYFLVYYVLCRAIYF